MSKLKLATMSISFLIACGSELAFSEDFYLDAMGCKWRIGPSFERMPSNSEDLKIWRNHQNSLNISYTSSRAQEPEDALSIRKEMEYFDFKMAEIGDLEVLRFSAMERGVFKVRNSDEEITLITFSFEEFSDFASSCFDAGALEWEVLD